MTVGYALFKNSTLYQPFCDDTDNWDIIKYLTKLQTDYRNLSYYDIFNYKLQDSGISFLKESMNTKVSNRKSASNLMKNGFIRHLTDANYYERLTGYHHPWTSHQSGSGHFSTTNQHSNFSNRTSSSNFSPLPISNQSNFNLGMKVSGRARGPQTEAIPENDITGLIDGLLKE